MCEINEMEYYGYFPSMYEITKLIFEYERAIDDK